MAGDREELVPVMGDEPFFKALKFKCEKVCKQVITDCSFELLLISNNVVIIQSYEFQKK